MKALKIIFANLKRDALHNIIMIIFVTLAVFFMDISLSRFMHMKYINNFVNDCGLYENYIYIAPPSKSVYSQLTATNYIYEQLEQMRSEGIINDYFSAMEYHAPLYPESPYENHVKFKIYQREFALDINFPVSRGRWFNESDFESEYTPVVLGCNYIGKFKLGDIVPLWVESAESDRGFVDCKVIGFLARDTMILQTGSSGSDMSTDMLFEIGNDTIIASVEHLTEYGRFGTVVKASPQNQQTVLDAVCDITETFTFRYMADNSYEDNKIMTEMQSVIFILMMIVCIAGVSSGNLLATIACKKKYAIYFMCGMDWKTGVRITLAESVIKLVLPAIIGYTMFMRWCVKWDYWQLRVTSVNVIVTVIFIAVIFLLTSLMPLLDIKRTSPVKIITET